jgi:hypothetical protein
MGLATLPRGVYPKQERGKRYSPIFVTQKSGQSLHVDGADHFSQSHKGAKDFKIIHVPIFHLITLCLCGVARYLFKVSFFIKKGRKDENAKICWVFYFGGWIVAKSAAQIQEKELARWDE